jgi:drug/metabolite transporter (DMT)-like permease
LANLTKTDAKPTLMAWLILFFLAIIWGSSFILVKKAMFVFSPFQVGSARTTMAFLAISALALIYIRKVPLKKYPLLLLSGSFGVLIPAFLFPLAQTRLSSSVAGILNALTPAFTLIISVIFFGRSTHQKQLIGLSIGFLGACSLILLNSSGNLEINSYSLIVVLATILYGINANVVQKYLSDFKPLHVASLSLFCISPFALVSFGTADFNSTFQSNPQSSSAFYALVMLGVFSSAFATIIFYHLIQMSGAMFASSVTYLIPLVAVVWGLMDGEKLALGHYGGMALIIIGVYMINQKK